MSIAPMLKATIVGPAKDATSMMSRLQSLGCLHQISLSRQDIEQQVEIDADAARALKYLCASRRQRRMFRRDTDFDFTATVQKALTNEKNLRRINDRCDALAERIRIMEPWGAYQFPDKNVLDGMLFWFYIVPLYKVKNIVDTDLMWQIVNRDNRNAYIVVLAKDEPPVDALPAPRAHTGSVPLYQLYQNLETAELEREEWIAEREALTRWIYLLKKYMARAEDHAALNRAVSRCWQDEDLFVLQGWIPEQKSGPLQEMLRHEQVASLIETPSRHETPPTLLTNRPLLSAGEDVVKFYQMPAYWLWDPSIMVFLFFSVFFAMILSDAGYALLFLLLLLILWRRFDHNPVWARLRYLVACIGVFSLLYGILAGSYFGLPPPEFLVPFHLLHIDNYSMMMGLSIITGSCHIMLAHTIMAWHERGSRHAWTHMGWIMVITAAFLIWLPGHHWARAAGIGTMAAGFMIIGWFASSPGSEISSPWKRLLLRLFGAARALSGVTQTFSDILSYMRLFALGLASASLAGTFNQIAHQSMESSNGLGLLLALLVALFGHSMNILLALVSGVVHGLRLNYIEFYHYAMPQDGYAFSAFCKKEDDL